ncbi:MAG: NAD-dependent epimerase/dehydratase family protein [Bacteroidetes bacterium]|nr:NAD-dependent epimerase/dehydratase family protein [Bacteroidota bacterium]
MKCLIIGSEGYIGSHLKYYIKSKGFELYCYDYIDLLEEKYSKIDILDYDSVKTIDFNVDLVFLIAGKTGTYDGFDNYEDYININELGLLNVLNAIRISEFRPRLIFPSTRLVYKGSDYPLKESDEKYPKTIYAVNKLACEHYLNIYKENFKINYTIFRICVPFGNIFSDDYSFGTIGFFIKQAKSGKNINLYGNGSIKRTFTYINDLIFQIVEASILSESKNEIYNIGGITLSLKQAAEIVSLHFDKIKINYIPWPKQDLIIESGSTFFDDTKLKKIIGKINYVNLKEIKIC